MHPGGRTPPLQKIYLSTMTGNKTKYNPEIHHRRSIRLADYDYSAEGFYFITICTQDKRCLFGEVINKEMVLNEIGKIIEECFLSLNKKYQTIRCWEYVIMPNHFHCIIQIVNDDVGAGSARPNTFQEVTSHDDNRAGEPRLYHPTIGQIIGYFKYQTTKKINLSTRLWQRNYYEHIIRNQESHEEISDYILTNPSCRERDKLYREEETEI